MKPIYVVLASIGALLLFMFLGYYNLYNNAVGLQEGLDEKFANVQSAYQRRADLIPNLLETVKGAAQNEKDILTQVTQARAGIVNAKTPEDLEIMGKKSTPRSTWLTKRIHKLSLQRTLVSFKDNLRVPKIALKPKEIVTTKRLKPITPTSEVSLHASF